MEEEEKRRRRRGGGEGEEEKGDEAVEPWKISPLSWAIVG